jgi:hypothetical protein
MGRPTAYCVVHAAPVIATPPTMLQKMGLVPYHSACVTLPKTIPVPLPAATMVRVYRSGVKLRSTPVRPG